MSIEIINIYAPTVDSPLFFKKVFDIIDSNSLDYFLLCGDDPTVDWYNGPPLCKCGLSCCLQCVQ